MSKSKSLIHKDQPFISLPLFDTIHAILGDEQDGVGYAPISPVLAMVIREVLATNNTGACVQIHNFDGELLTVPKLWYIKEYNRARELHISQEEYKRKQRVKDRIHDTNIRAIMDSLMAKGISEEVAYTVAYKFVATGSDEVTKLVGVEHLITSEEELK